MREGLILVFEYVVSWESEGHFYSSMMLHWEPEVHYRCTKSMAIVPFWFSLAKLLNSSNTLLVLSWQYSQSRTFLLKGNGAILISSIFLQTFQLIGHKERHHYRGRNLHLYGFHSANFISMLNSKYSIQIYNNFRGSSKNYELMKRHKCNFPESKCMSNLLYPRLAEGIVNLTYICLEGKLLFMPLNAHS